MVTYCINWQHAVRLAERRAFRTGRRHVVKRIAYPAAWPLNVTWGVAEVGVL